MESELVLTLNKNSLFKLIKMIRELRKIIPKDKENIVKIHKLNTIEFVLNNILQTNDEYILKLTRDIQEQTYQELLKIELLNEEKQ